MSDYDYLTFFLNAPSKIIRFECLEIYHPDFSKTYYVVRNATKGLTVTHENGQTVDYEYWPLKIQPLGVYADLDTGIRVDLGDLGELLPIELNNVIVNGDLNIKPKITYRTYRSDYLTAPMEGPYLLEVSTVSYNKEGCSFEAIAPLLNLNTTGEIYDLNRFYPLRNFLY